jgi:hypothetical protein
MTDKPLTPSVRPIKLRKRPPAPVLRKLPVRPFKWIYWVQEHTEPGTCGGCYHSGGSHAGAWAPGLHAGCNVTDCRCGIGYVAPVRESVQRRGQFLALGARNRHVWVIPFEAAPWEHGRAAAVELHVDELNQQPPRAAQSPELAA